MRTRSIFSRSTAFATATILLLAYAPHANAEEVSPTGKGIVGGALLGAEVVTMTESLIGLKDGWMYAVGAGVGGIGGGLGGWAVESNSTDGRVPTYMLAGGMALVIPAVVLILNATRYKPSEDATEDKAPTGPAANPGNPGGTSVLGAPPSGGSATPPPGPPAPAPSTPPPPQSSAIPGALFDMHSGAFRMGVPVPDVRPVYSMREQKELGVPQQAMVRMPVLHVAF